MVVFIRGWCEEDRKGEEESKRKGGWEKAAMGEREEAIKKVMGGKGCRKWQRQ